MLTASEPAISVLIVNYRTAELAVACIGALLRQKNVTYEIIVIDNHSEDDSGVSFARFGTLITLVKNTENIGFGRANNQAFQLSKGRYLFILNPDAHCLSDHDLANAIEWMDSHPQYGLAGTQVVDKHHHIQKTTYPYYPRQREAGLDFSHLPGDIAAVLGASMLIRRSVFEEVNGFDEDFFLYGEETDLCLRIRQSGHAIGYCDRVTVQHIGGASEQFTPREIIILKKRGGKILFFRKHYPKKMVRHMMRRDLWHTTYHLWRLKILNYFLPLSPKQKQKILNLTVIHNMAQEALKSG